MPRRSSRNQLAFSFDDLVASVGEAPVATSVVVEVAAGHRSLADRLAGHVEQIRRDLAVLSGPPTYCCDRAFYEWRVEAHREGARRISAQLG